MIKSRKNTQPKIPWDEPILYKATGQFLSSEGLPEAPIHSWGLVALTSTHLRFLHFAQSHPLFGGKDEEIEWGMERSAFTTCQLVRQTWWTRWWNGIPNHQVLEGPGVRLQLETVDDQKGLSAAWLLPLDR